MMDEENSRIIPAIKQGYEDAIIKADKFVGRVLRLLEDVSVTDETLLVLTGDHGDSFNEHDEIHRAVDKRYEHGQFLYDNIIKVPLILYWPKKRFARVFDEQVQQIDIVPTILEALNVSYDGDLDGKSLWSAITGETAKLKRSFAFSEVVRERWGVERRCVRSMSSKLIRDYKNNTYELYDLRIDAEEKSNLWPGDGYDERTVLMAELEAFSKIASDVKVAYSESQQRK
jgi:arylsulfatase A-like enzyme